MVLVGPLRGPRAAAGLHPRPEAKREEGTLLDFLAVHAEHGPVGVTGLSEYVRRDRRATVGTWFGRPFWGIGDQRGVQGADRPPRLRASSASTA